MGPLVSYPHIEADEAGVPRVGRTRYKVSHLAAEHFHYGWSAEELMRQHPDLKPGEVYAALTYFYDHREEMLRQMEERDTRVLELEGITRNLSPSREDLLRRRSTDGPK